MLTITRYYGDQDGYTGLSMTRRGQKILSPATKVQNSAVVEMDAARDPYLAPLLKFLSFTSAETVERDLHALYEFLFTTTGASTHDELIVGVGDYFAEIKETFDEMDFTRYLNIFATEAGLPYPDLSQAGTKPYHSAEATFYHEDYVALNIIILLAKFGDLMWRSVGGLLMEGGMNNADRIQLGWAHQKILFDTPVTKPVFDRFSALLRIWVDRQCTSWDARSVRPRDKSSAIFERNGMTQVDFQERFLATIFLGRIPAFDIFARDRNGGVNNILSDAYKYIGRNAWMHLKCMM